MNENLGKKITITVVLAVAAILCLVLPKKPFRLGLDLQGGTRIVCRFDFDEALKLGRISAVAWIPTACSSCPCAPKARTAS
jgi:preprotein translocase subunit SecD